MIMIDDFEFHEVQMSRRSHGTGRQHEHTVIALEDNERGAWLRPGNVTPTPRAPRLVSSAVPVNFLHELWQPVSGGPSRRLFRFSPAAVTEPLRASAWVNHVSLTVWSGSLEKQELN